jgi:hypothetical protein
MALDPAAASAVWGEGVGSSTASLGEGATLRRGAASPDTGTLCGASRRTVRLPKAPARRPWLPGGPPAKGARPQTLAALGVAPNAATPAALGVAPEALEGGSLPGRAAQRRGTRSARDGPPARALGARRRLATSQGSRGPVAAAGGCGWALLRARRDRQRSKPLDPRGRLATPAWARAATKAAAGSSTPSGARLLDPEAAPLRKAAAQDRPPDGGGCRVWTVRVSKWNPSRPI